MRSRRKTKIAIGLFLIGLLGLLGCGSPSSDCMDSDENITETADVSGLVYESSMELQYAEEFSVDYYQGGYALLTVADDRRYLIVPEDQKIPKGIAENITILQQPLEQVYLVATAAMDMFCTLDELDSIRFSGQKTDGWTIEEVQQKMERGDILYAGKYSEPDYELLLAEGSSLAIENNMISHTPEVIEKLENLDIPVFIDFSSYESHPLGRVEWIKVYGLLLGKEAEAQATFAEQCEMVNRVTQDASSEKTVAFFFITSNGMVNVRCSNDYVPKMIELAGGRYIFNDLGEDSARSSVTMQMEEFYAVAKDADYLIYNSTIDGELESVDELLQKEELLADFRAVQTGNVWCTTKDLYQQSMSIGGMIEDIHNMLLGTPETENDMKYLYLLK